MKKFLLFGLLAAVLPAVAEEATDRKTATSLKYVEHELDTRQNKFTAEQNKAMEYTNAAGTVEKRTVKSDLGTNTSDTSLPMVGGVNTKLATKQDDIAPINDHTVVTYTGTSGKIGAKGIYQATESYVEQSDNLIDAKTFNAALKRGLDSEFLCSEYKPGTDLCWVWSIHNNGPKNLYDPATNPIEQGNINSSNGQPINNLGEKRVRTGFINVEPNTQYTISSGGLSYIFVYQYRSDETYLSGNSIAWHASPSTFTTSQSTGKIRILLANGQNPDTSTSITPSDLLWLQVEAGSTATPYQDVQYTTLVPAGYTPVEYIISNGTQYFDSGRKATEKSEVSVTVMATVSDSTKNRLIGNYADPSRAFSLNMSTTGGSSRFGNQVVSGIAMPIGSKHVFSNGAAGLRMDAEVLRAWTAQPAFETPGNVALLASTNTTTTVPSNLTNGLAGNTYNITWHEDGVLVMNLIPARRNQDSVVGMYDTVSGTFFENAGTGVFQAGPDINNIIYVPQGQN